MDQMPRNNEGFASNHLFANNQQYNAYDNLFPTGNDQNSYDASWGVHASNYPASSRANQPPAPSWPQNANNLPAGNINTQASPYGRSLSPGSTPYGQSPYSFGGPQNFQYRQPQYDPSLVPPHAFNPGFNNFPTTNYETPNAGTIAPHALQHDSRSPAFSRNPYDGSDYSANPARASKAEFVNQNALAGAIPRGNNAGYFSIVSFDGLAQGTLSERMGNFLNIGTEALNWNVTRAALPAYVPRKSRNELRKVAGNDPKVLAKLGKKIVKKEKTASGPPKQPLGASAAGSPSSAEKIKYEGDTTSEDESSSDDDDGSSYTSDDIAEPSPLPTKRPLTPKEATEYDTIKALWRSKRKRPDSQSIRKGLVGFWEIAKTIRDRWKADATAVTDAESKNRDNELPLLRSRVADQRDMMEAAFKTVLKHGHRDIVELFSENNPLIFLCYQFLLDRVKAEDFNTPLPRAMLETLSVTSTLTEEKLEKTHLSKVLPRFVKKGDAKTQYYAKRILSNAAQTANAKSAEPAIAKKATGKDGSAASPTRRQAEPEPVAGVKRAATTAGEGGVQKKVATATSKSTIASTVAKQNGVVKKQGTGTDSTKPATNAATAAVKPKQVVAKPSGLFSSLQSAAKKPGTSNASKAAQSTGNSSIAKPIEKTGTTSTATPAAKPTFSFAETMANLSKPKEEKPATKEEKPEPSETPEQKAKRLRKESRRNLHVQFKTGDQLAQVHVFHHDPDEELGHDASQVRDVGDVGGEGRMFKQQHQMMDIDEEDEGAEADEALIEFVEPSKVNFNDVDEDERKRNFAPYGGGELAPESAERAIREHYEANNLMVFYADVSDIPPNPREPSNPYNGEPVGTLQKFGRPEEKYAARARQKRAGVAQTQGAGQDVSMPGTAPHGFDLSALTNFVGNQQHPQANASQPPQQQPPALSSDAISNILANLKQAAPNQAAPQPPPLGTYSNQYPAGAPNISAPQTTGQPDLAAILAQIQSGSNQASAPPSYGYNAQPAAPNMMGFQPQAQQPTMYENPERKQWREGGNNYMNRDKRQNPVANPYYKTKVCKYWQEGRCQKGDQCTYRHEEP